MSKMRTILVQGKSIAIDENDYVSLTDITKHISDKNPDTFINSWLSRFHNLRYLNAWETMHNEEFDVEQMESIILKVSESKLELTLEHYQKQTGAIGIISKLDFHGDVFAHKDIAMSFLYFSPAEFQVYFRMELIKLQKKQEERDATTWKISKIMDDVNNAQKLLDMMLKQGNNLKNKD